MENEFIPVAYRQNVRQQTTKDGFIRPIWRQTFMCICTVVGYELYDSNKRLIRKLTPELAQSMKDRCLIIEVTTTL